MFLSHSRVGSLHDYKFLKYEFSPYYDWFRNFNIRVDLGYLGIIKDYVCKSVAIPNKKPPKKELTESQKNENKVMASERIAVENSIAGLKRFRVLSDRLRIHDIDLYDEILGICAGLWNFNLHN